MTASAHVIGAGDGQSLNGFWGCASWANRSAAPAGSIPGSSTENPLVRAASSGQFSFSSTSHQHRLGRPAGVAAGVRQANRWNAARLELSQPWLDKGGRDLFGRNYLRPTGRT